METYVLSKQPHFSVCFSQSRFYPQSSFPTDLFRFAASPETQELRSTTGRADRLAAATQLHASAFHLPTVESILQMKETEAVSNLPGAA